MTLHLVRDIEWIVDSKAGYSSAWDNSQSVDKQVVYILFNMRTTFIFVFCSLHSCLRNSWFCLKSLVFQSHSKKPGTFPQLADWQNSCLLSKDHDPMRKIQELLIFIFIFLSNFILEFVEKGQIFFSHHHHNIVWFGDPSLKFFYPFPLMAARECCWMHSYLLLHTSYCWLQFSALLKRWTLGNFWCVL